jgi:5-formyltetrahydrofolate cyclo-ligase
MKTHANEHMLTKKNIREAKLKERGSTTVTWREKASFKIASHLKFFLFSAPFSHPIAGYWPIGSEADPRPLMKELAAAGLDLCLPMTHKTDLSYHVFAFGDELQPAGFGTFAPKINTPQIRPLTLLVPLVAFDKTGARIGWGKGFYDRSIVDLKSGGQPLITIGIAYSFQQVDHVPVEPHDIGLDYVLTEKEVIRF